MQDRPIRPAQQYRDEDEDNYDNPQNIVEEEKGDDEEKGPSLNFNEDEGVVGGQEPELEKEVDNYMHRGEYQDAYNTLKRLEQLDNTKPVCLVIVILC